MDRRLLLAIALMLGVTILPSLIWPPQRGAPPARGADSVAPEPAADSAPTASQTIPGPVAVAPVGAAPVTAPADTGLARTVVVESDLYRYEFSTRGARLQRATLHEYRAFAPTDSGPAQLLPESSRLLAYTFVVGRDTFDFAASQFSPTSTRSGSVRPAPP
jgi:YidC/Oxa1 family membrane protein insertase